MAQCPTCGRGMTRGRCARCGAAVQTPAAPGRLAVVGLIVAVLVGVCTALVAGRSGGLSRPTMATRIDTTTGAPLDAVQVLPRETRIIYAAVKLHASAGDVVAVRWFVAGQHLAAFDQETRLTQRFTGWRTWSASLKDTRPWPAASFTVRFYLNGIEKAAVDFRME